MHDLEHDIKRLRLLLITLAIYFGAKGIRRLSWPILTEVLSKKKVNNALGTVCVIRTVTSWNSAIGNVTKLLDG